MALANIACLLAKRAQSTGKKVLIIDWDLEAPGLYRFFSTGSDARETSVSGGVIDYFHNLNLLLTRKWSLYPRVSKFGWTVLEKIIPIQDYITSEVEPGVDLMMAGKLDEEYIQLVNGFDWDRFYKRYKLALEAFRDLLNEKYSYCLIDSRTGFTDISGICTMLLPEKLVAVFTANYQSLNGVLDLVRQATRYRSRSDDFRSLAVFPLPSRIEDTEIKLRQQWRLEYQRHFEELFREVYDLQQCDLTRYFDEVKIPHFGYYAYGEKIAVLEEKSEALTLARQYEVFFQQLMNLDFAWEQNLSQGTESIQSGPISSPAAETLTAELRGTLAAMLHALEDVLSDWRNNILISTGQYTNRQISTLERSLSNMTTIVDFAARSLAEASDALFHSEVNRVFDQASRARRTIASLRNSVVHGSSDNAEQFQAFEYQIDDDLSALRFSVDALLRRMNSNIG
jgi:cellulose biosynthesis protein BcsQ